MLKRLFLTVLILLSIVATGHSSSDGISLSGQLIGCYKGGRLHDISGSTAYVTAGYYYSDGNAVLSEIKIDGKRVWYDYPKRSATIDISEYQNDGLVHEMKIIFFARDIQHTSSFYFASNASCLLGYDTHVLYETQGSQATAVGCISGIEHVVLPSVIVKDGKEFTVTSFEYGAFGSAYDISNLPVSFIIPKSITKGSFSPIHYPIDITDYSSGRISSIPKNSTLHTFPRNLQDVRKYGYDALHTGLENVIIDELPDINITNTNVALDYFSFNIENEIGATVQNIRYSQSLKKNVSDNTYRFDNATPLSTHDITIEYAHPDYGELEWTKRFILPSPLKSVILSDATQSTATFLVEKYDQIDDRIGVPYITFGEQKFYCNNNGKITVTDLPSNTSASQQISVTFMEQEFFTNCDYQTLPMNPDVIAEVGPTTISVTPTYDKIDGIIKSSSLTINGQEYAGKAQTIGGLTPGSSVSVVYSLNNENAERVFQLHELVLTTLPARATSKDCAIICAETNMSEDEIGGGFEWRRYDAPDMVPSNSVACPVANGHMEGRLNGLSSGTYYKYRPFYEDATGQKTYGEWTALGTADVDVYFVPTVYTYTARSVGSTSATLVGYALAGSEDVTEQGFEYWPEVTSRAATTEVKCVLATGQRMMATIDDLEPGMTYNVRAFATTKTETTYGELQQFETEAIDDPIEDSIEEVETVEPSGQFDIYTLTGVCVRRNATDFSGLRSGIYIANGRKIMVR